MALEQLREDENIRTQALVQFRKWVQMHPRIRNCPLDNVFLLRFLRARKFNITESGQMLESYLKALKTHPQWYRNLSLDDAIISEIIDRGVFRLLPSRDKLGRQMIIIKVSQLIPGQHTLTHYVRTGALVQEFMLLAEENQVGRWILLFDVSGVDVKNLKYLSLVELRNYVNTFYSCMPIRVGAVVSIHVAQWIIPILEICKSVATQKIRDRTYFCKDDSILYTLFDVKALPKEYGGVVDDNEMIEKIKVLAKKHREDILRLDDIEYKLANGNSTGSDGVDIDTGLSGSFRTLEVD